MSLALSLFPSLCLGLAAGLRSFTPLCAVALAAWLGRLDLSGTQFGFLASGAAAIILAGLALAEYVGDKLPIAPDRTRPAPFAFRIVAGAVAGAAAGSAGGASVAGGGVGALAALCGTLGGFAARGRLARAFGRDLPAALLEDAAALALAGLAIWLVWKG